MLEFDGKMWLYQRGFQRNSLIITSTPAMVRRLRRTVVPLWIFKNPKILQLLWKIPRLNKNSQAYWKYKKTVKMRTLLHTASTYIRKLILLGSRDDVTDSELVRVTVRIRTSSDNVNSAGLPRLFEKMNSDRRNVASVKKW